MNKQTVIGTKKHLNLPVVKELPVELSSLHVNDENGVWVWATREVRDTGGDMVRVDGVDFGTYHNPPETHLKILAQHIRVLPDGKSPVVGTVKDYVRTRVPYKGKLVKALALYVEWLRDTESQELLDLAAHYKQQVGAGGIDSVSVGVIVDDYEEFDDGGMDITRCTIFETSFVTIPMLGAANVVRQIKALQDALGDYLDPTAVETALATAAPTQERTPEFSEKQVNALGQLVGEHVAAKFAGSVNPLKDSIESLIKTIEGLSERVDAIESAFVIQSASVTQETGDRLSESAAKHLLDLSHQMDRIDKYLGS